MPLGSLKTGMMTETRGGESSIFFEAVSSFRGKWGETTYAEHAGMVERHVGPGKPGSLPLESRVRTDYGKRDVLTTTFFGRMVQKRD